MGLGRVKGLEKPVELLQIDPRAGVLHFDEHIVWITYSRHDRELAWWLAGAAHRFDGIDYEIDQYLLELDPIRQDKG